MLQTDGINWNKGHICSAHWSHEEKKSINDLPDIPTPADHLQKIQEKYEAAKNSVPWDIFIRFPILIVLEVLVIGN